MSHGWRLSPRLWDRIARHVITAGGLALVAAVLAILVFIVREALPLLGGAEISTATAGAAAPVDAPAALLAGTDEYLETGFLVLPERVHFFRCGHGDSLGSMSSPFAPDAAITCAAYAPGSGLLALGAADGRAAVVRIEAEVRWTEAGRAVLPAAHVLGTALVDSTGQALRQVVADRDEDGVIAFASFGGTEGAPSIHYASLAPAGGPAVSLELSGQLGQRRALALTLSLRAGLLGVGSEDGMLSLWDLAAPEAPRLEDHVKVGGEPITALQFLPGNEAIAVGTAAGEVSVWFRVRYARVRNEGATALELNSTSIDAGAEVVAADRDLGRRLAYLPSVRVTTAGRVWTRIHAFPGHTHAVTHMAASPRVKGFASLDAAGKLALHHSTSSRTLAVVDAASARSLVFAPRGDGLVALDGRGRILVWNIDNPHPEAGVGALFGKVWYEGYAQPEHVWQSTGGSEEFEPKLGLVPLFVGTLKGTLYAMLFSVPLAILAALYISQLVTPKLRNVIKPAVEFMSAVPSVVVGFLAALWLAPLLEANLAGWIGALLLMPLGLGLALGFWLLLPRPWQQAAPAGMELLVLAPFLGAACWFGASLGAPLAGWLFGGDLQQWLYDRHGNPYDQRNCLVVGIAHGVAVIPIIFSICEDAMSSVPRSLTGAALALGASRWQTAWHVILPAASGGIFAAVMLGLGRAIGETMIVLMATGNTPILDLSPFNGMRTMSAALAVEIPEAPHGGTLYRVLFLTGSLLFAFTFLINTSADWIGRRLRRRYAQF